MPCAAIAGMTMSPQLRESPETMNLQVPSFSGTNLEGAGASLRINRLDKDPSFQTTIPRMIALTRNWTIKGDENFRFGGLAASSFSSDAVIFFFSDSAFGCIDAA